MAEMNPETMSDDLQISCERWAIQSELIKVHEMEALKDIHQYVKKHLEKAGKGEAQQPLGDEK